MVFDLVRCKETYHVTMALLVRYWRFIFFKESHHTPATCYFGFLAGGLEKKLQDREVKQRLLLNLLSTENLTFKGSDVYDWPRFKMTLHCESQSNQIQIAG